MEEYNRIRKLPYLYIQEWMESNLVCVGSQAFKILSFIPMSLFLPKIPFGSTSIRMNMSVMLIALPNAGKSTIAKKFSYLCYNPLLRRAISAPDLSEEASRMKWISVIIEDFAETVEAYGYDVVKVLEGILGEEENINRSNMRADYSGEVVKGIGLLGITPQDLERYAKSIETGLLSRCLVCFIKLSHEDYNKISDFINKNAGDTHNEASIKRKEEVVIEFYDELRWIQRGKHKEYLEKKNLNYPIIPAVTGYSINPNFKEEVSKVWNKLSNRLLKSGNAPQVRNLHEYYRILISSAFLNIHSRNHDNGILVPNEDDHKIALEIMKENMRYKWAIPLAIKGNKSARTLDALERFINRGIPEIVKDVLINISPYGKFLKD